MKAINESTSKAYFNQLSESHPEAIRTSKLNTKFNVFKDEWAIDNCRTGHLSGLHDSNFNLDEQTKIRLTLADVVNQNSPKVSTLCIQSIMKNNIKVLSIHGLKLLVSISRTNSSDSKINIIKTFLKKLAIRYPEYKHLEKYICSIKIRKSQPSIYDSKKGALTEYEYNSLCVNLNTKSDKLFTNPVLRVKYSLDQFINLRSFVSLRLLQSTSRRPTQLSHLKWCDLNFEKNQVMDALTLRMTKVKQKTSLGFRKIFERYEIPLDTKTSIDLINFKNI